MLSPPLAWFLVIYVASLVVMLVTAFWTTDPLTTQVVHTWSLDNFRQIFTSPAYRTIILRTVEMAAAVTITDVIVAVPFGYYMARIASSRVRSTLFVLVLLPLWASYIARVYAWILILNHDGVLNWAVLKVGLPAPNIGYSNVAMWIVFCYLWLPFMIIPVYSAFERVPHSYVEASLDLGARHWTTTRRILLPLALPGIVAGSIFTFSLTLGDFITPILVGGAGSNFIGNVIYDNVGVAHNLPFAAALAMIPIAIMAAYLLLARALGAFEAI